MVISFHRRLRSWRSVDSPANPHPTIATSHCDCCELVSIRYSIFNHCYKCFEFVFSFFEEGFGVVVNRNSLDAVSLLDLIHYRLVFIRFDFSEDGMFVIEPLSFDMGDEELASVRSRSSVCH